MSITSGILFFLLAGLSLGGLLWWQSIRMPATESCPGTPDVYTIENVHPEREHYVEQDGVVQAFVLLETHPPSGYFHIEVLPPDEHQLNRDHPRVRGWTDELLANRLIQQEGLFERLPVEMGRSIAL